MAKTLGSFSMPCLHHSMVAWSDISVIINSKVGNRNYLLPLCNRMSNPPQSGFMVSLESSRANWVLGDSLNCMGAPVLGGSTSDCGEWPHPWRDLCGLASWDNVDAVDLIFLDRVLCRAREHSEKSTGNVSYATILKWKFGSSSRQSC